MRWMPETAESEEIPDRAKAIVTEFHDAEIFTKTLFIKGVLCVWGVALPYVTVYTLVTNGRGHLWSAILLLAAHCVAGLLIWWYQKRQNIAMVALILGASYCILPLLDTCRLGSLRGMFSHIVPLGPPLVTVLGGNLAGAAAAIVVILEYLIFYVLQITNVFREVDVIPHRLVVLFTWLRAIAMYILTVAYFETLRNHPVQLLQEVHKDHREAVARLSTEHSALRNIIAGYAHELRVPLTVIAAMADQISAPTLDEETAQEVIQIQAAAHNVVNVTNNTLDLSAMHAKALHIEHEDFDLSAMLRRLEASLAPAITRKNLKLTRIVDEDVPQYVRGDGLRVQQILYSLLSNAVRYTTRGLVTLHVKISPQAQNTSDNSDLYHVLFEIRDSGPGLSVTASENLFHVVSSSAQHRLSRPALGLCIARKLARRMGGKICLANVKNHGGTLCHFSLAFEKPSNLCLSGESAVSVHPLTILYADDETANHFVITKLLENTPHKLVLAKDGAQAVSAFIDMKPRADLVILDVMMPVLDGTEALRQIRQWEYQTGIARTPVVFLTAHSTNKLASHDYDLSLPKPVARSQLLDAITRCSATERGNPVRARLQQHAALQDMRTHEPVKVRARRTFYRILDWFLTPDLDGLVFPVWKYRFMVLISCLNCVLTPTLANSRFEEMSAATIVCVVSYLLFPILMRYGQRRMLNVYTVVQPLCTMPLTLYASPFGFRAIMRLLHLFFPPLLVMLTDGSLQLNVTCSFLVAFEACVLCLIMPEQPLSEELMVAFTDKIVLALVVMTVILTTYGIASDIVRTRTTSELLCLLRESSIIKAKMTKKRESVKLFVASLAYEYRTSFAVIAGVAQMIANRSDIDDLLRRDMKLMEGAAEFLTNVVDHVSCSIPAMDGDVPLSPRRHPKASTVYKLRDVIHSTLSILSFFASLRNTTLHVQVSKRLPEYVQHDPQLLQQTLIHLITGALQGTVDSSNILRVGLYQDPYDELLDTGTEFVFGHDVDHDADMLDKMAADTSWQLSPPDSPLEDQYEPGGRMVSISFMFKQGTLGSRTTSSTEAGIFPSTFIKAESVTQAQLQNMCKPLGATCVNAEPGLFSFVVTVETARPDQAPKRPLDHWPRVLSILIVDVCFFLSVANVVMECI
eukprot:TRINITY_DN302_c0_g1_i3.p1 TRINITY_DN302_c0_g1~~TRINITY_DN302_c0_g1_i3.p1  ORF type:complete len:1144 (+),score=262.75 TRINITY_DN302_c0_g1_i3:62-3493(+)